MTDTVAQVETACQEMLSTGQEITAEGELIRQLTLDTTKDYQPSGR